MPYFRPVKIDIVVSTDALVMSLNTNSRSSVVYVLKPFEFGKPLVMGLVGTWQRALKQLE